jgi:hypothetical protein
MPVWWLYLEYADGVEGLSPGADEARFTSSCAYPRKVVDWENYSTIGVGQEFRQSQFVESQRHQVTQRVSEGRDAAETGTPVPRLRVGFPRATKHAAP